MPRYKHETTITNRDTGEVTTTSKTEHISKVKNSEEFYMCYIQTMAMMMKITSMEDIRLLTKLCLMMSYGTNEVHLTTQRRQQAAKELGVHDTTISRSIGRLKKLGIISGDRGEYQINPIFYWKGTNETRDKLLREQGLTFKIQFGGKENDD